MQRIKTSELQRNILKTLVYADIFDYPLTSREVANYLISSTKTPDQVVSKQLRILTDSKEIYTDGEYYFFKGRDKIVKLRKERGGWSKEKWIIAENTANKLKIIPTIKMIGITGALAMNNCKKYDDIDLLIITARNTLWLTRLLLILSTPFLGISRRKPNDQNINNKICFNLFLDEDHLKIKPENLFLAHEIVQVKPIYDKGGINGKFMLENQWVRNFLPNAVEILNVKCQMSKPKLKAKNFFRYFFNLIAFNLQYLYMKPKMTIEKVNLYQAFFHPKNLNDKIQKEFERRTKSLKKDELFLHRL